jgi:sugar phosphate isomerase/epimerase
MHPFSRRQFVKLSAATAAGLALQPWLGAAPAAGGEKLPVALQLYSVRNDCKADFDGTLARVAKLGFDGVEFAGYYRYVGKAQELRKRLDGLGLKAPSTHVGSAAFRGDQLQKTIEFHQTLGCKFLIIAGDRDFTDPEKSKAFAEFLNEVSSRLTATGMACGYHNHTKEFTTKFGDKTAFDAFAERTRKEVVLQQDCGWTAAAGVNPVEVIQRYPGRFRSTHFKPTVLGKDPAKKAILGRDSVDWVAVLATCRSVGGTEWITLEQETYPEGRTPMECTELSFQALKKLL